MADRGLRRDALAHRGLRSAAREPGAGVRLWLEPPRTQLSLRGRVADKSFVAAVRKTIGAPPPTKAHAVTRGERAQSMWMGPDEWLVVTASPDAALHAELEQAIGAAPSLVSDVSHSRAIIGLAGERARDTLAKGFSIDLHPRKFAVDQVMQSALARAHAMVHRLDDVPTFHLYVHRSFADYAFQWLSDAGAEFGVSIG